MFTGIVTSLGRVRDVTGTDIVRFELTAPFPAAGIDMGASIAHAGVCLTVVDKGELDKGCWYAVEVSPETLRLTTLGDWRVGARVNLERSLKIGDELGGHLVAGHVDGIGTVIDHRQEGDWLVYTIRPPESLSKFIARKGSITIDGVSLTVNEATESTFRVMVIPHTASVTTLGKIQTGDHVNLEVDLMARYAARLNEFVETPA